MKKILCLLLCMLTLVTLSASAEFWGGLSISSGRNYFSSSLKKSLQVNPIYKDTYMVNTIGPYFDAVFFPSSKVRAGVVGSAGADFTISRNSVGYFSRHFDNSLDFSLGLAYYQLLSNDTWGFFIDSRYFSKIYNYATNNEKNNKLEQFEYTRCDESGVNTSIGFLAKLRNRYFKMGFKFALPLTSGFFDGWRLDIFAGGGVCF